MTREQNIRAILESNFAGFKDEIIDVAVKNIMALSENKGEWISVSERLPENTEYVLATDGLDMFVAWHNSEKKEMFKGWHSFDDHFDKQYPILAWRPLPEPYKAESEDKK